MTENHSDRHDTCESASMSRGFALIQQKTCELTMDGRKARLPTVDVLGARVRERRNELGLSQLQAAQLCGVDLGTISRIESGKMPNVSLAVVAKVARGLGLDKLTLEELLEPIPA